MKGLKIREKIGDVEGVATSNNNIGNVYFEKGDLEKALSFFQNSLMLNEKIGDTHGAAEAYGNIAHVHFEKGDFDRALEYAQKCLSISQKIGNTLMFANSLISSAEILLELGRTDAARENLEKGIALAQKHSMKSLEADALRIYGKLYMAVGDRVEALDCFARAIEIFEQIKKRDNSYYRTYYEYGKAREDPAMLKNALAWFEHTGNAHWVMRIKKCLVQMDTKV
jgi:tetratricopeptide (TPR) repeat protein